MTQIRWDKMSERDIQKLIVQGEQELARRSATKKRDARNKLAAVAREFGFNLNELLAPGKRGRPATRPPREKLPPKYRNPANPAQTWSGHGKRPMWANAHLQAGGDLSDLLIQKRRGRASTAQGQAKLAGDAPKAKTA
ncbi:MAG: H-NS histone family protein [Betaproteobacteria bacterium]|nr:H-NS histone family protein [Betaproteobacteria bacterium]